MKGLVIKNTGSWYTVKTDDGQLIESKIKGNFRLKGIRSTNPVAVGDRVELITNQEGTAFISSIEDRRNYIIRNDLGSGSGILSITALLLGASHATGVDIDPKAEDIARQNAAINQIFADRFTALTGDVIGDTAMMEKLEAHYDVVLANIVADVIIPLAPVVPHFLREDAVFICSGILDTREQEVRCALERAWLTVTGRRAMEQWRCLTAKRS